MQFLWVVLACAGLVAGMAARAAAPPDDATRFGKRETILDISLSPDGSRVAFLTPDESGQGSTLYTRGLETDAQVTRVTKATGKPERLSRCNWVAADRLACQVYWLNPVDGRFFTITRMIAVDADGSHLTVLSTREGVNSRGVALWGGSVIDWLPDDDGNVLMTRNYLPNDKTGTRLNSAAEGVGVDKLDTRTLAVAHVEWPAVDARDYISDGRGTVRIRGMRRPVSSGMESAVTDYSYRLVGSRNWQKLGEFNDLSKEGLEPYAVDHDRNIAFGFRKMDGRKALVSIALDGSLREQVIFARPDVDVDALIRIGRRNRVVGASYATDKREPVFFDPEIAKLVASLSKALPRQPLVRVVDSSVDESKLLIFAGSDDDPGAYYVLDRKTKQLQTLFAARGDLQGQHLAKVRAVSYPAADGTMIPAYITFPPGKEDAKDLPAIVLPHGGPSARDEWGFDWLSQFYAARGYVVLQPNFRGSSGYGDAWFQQNGFRSWRVAIGDVLDAGRWLVSTGTANPGKLAVVGWSYGGYAALQSAVVDPTVFKAVVAVAPVTDLAALKFDYIGWADNRLTADFIGEGPHIREGSPAQNAAKIKVPVLLFHGTIDRNVSYAQSRLMDSKLAQAGVTHELVTFEGLDHYLDDSTARADLLRRSDSFLRSKLGL